MQPDEKEATSGGQLGPGPKYQIHDEDRRRIENAFVYHSSKDDQPQRYVRIREKAKELAFLICESVKNSRERSLALTELEGAVMWANAGIARNE